ncbi:UDP binding domain-containing protein [Pseudonocardia nigra]|uniref:UDP binding domain-containing protein n=1 Tax=Pseudonocardia nigra TaxID=1921578 RepID=UPI0027E330EA|nr:UDP binding domain-containing protein [Pseudonocardia nigra]
MARPGVLVHGDLSPDQVLVTPTRAVLLDLDRAAAGPVGWDGASWAAAQVATGGCVVPAPMATVRVHDPKALANAARIRPELGYADSVTAACDGADVVLLATEWDQYRALDPEAWRAAGWRYRALGRPAPARRAPERAVALTTATT